LRNREDASVERTPDALDDIEPLLHVKAALDRVAAGTYGACLQCDEPIGIRRLAALPHAAFCIACQEDAEHGDVFKEPAGMQIGASRECNMNLVQAALEE
jgi:RNA polymerase-binding transcription factor DksA